MTFYEFIVPVIGLAIAIGLAWISNRDTKKLDNEKNLRRAWRDRFPKGT